MLGSAVSKGIDSLPGIGGTMSESNIQAYNQTHSDVGNQTEFNTTTETPLSDNMADISDAEINLKLQFAMSVSFMSGVIQVKRNSFICS